VGAEQVTKADRTRPPADLDAWLEAGAGGGSPRQDLIETSISWISLYADRALKLKKPLDLGFLDFSTLEKRRWACEREVAFNTTAAPGIYRRVHAITRDGRGVFALNGAGEVLDWVVEMRRFDAGATLTNQLSLIDGAFAEALGRKVARFHAAAPAGRLGGGAEGLNFVLRSNADLLRRAAPYLDSGSVERLAAATDEAFAVVTSLLDQRLREGFVRCCHGDLHLGNILLENAEPILFDCIEFSDRLREIDVLYDVAFLIMDLRFRGEREAANRLLNGWLDEAARSFDIAHLDGLAALSLFQSVRASVRAHVSGLEGRHDEARRYLAAAEAHLASRAPRLVAIGGLSGSGKSTLARALAPDLGPLPGAVVLRSDEIRKRLWRVAPTERLPPAAYGADSSAAVYRELLANAAACLRAGWAVVVDAVFLRPEERRSVEAVARDAGFGFEGIWLEASPTTLRARIERRVDDASDADGHVLDKQLAQDAGLVEWPRRSSPDR
jgi:aminoglycoside phosphotransferase family enzyme/predicted kinase